MTSPTTIPRHAFDGFGLTADGLWHCAFRSMASPVRVQLGPDGPDPGHVFTEIRELFAEVDRQCTRFDPDSDLMQANAAAQDLREVGPYCFAALRAARRAHRMTDGRFDPRVLTALCDLGYDRTWAQVDHAGPVHQVDVRPLRRSWRPKFEKSLRLVAVGNLPIDLGGIGKGLALRWAADLLRAAGCHTFLIDAGGDCVYGAGPGGPWRIGIEDPAGGNEPVVVVETAHGACTTSSTRVHTWHRGGNAIHHLIDPRTGQPGGGPLRSVTVAGTDPADAEVWSKVLFLEGADVARAAEQRDLAALWIDANGRIGMTSRMVPLVIWRRS